MRVGFYTLGCKVNQYETEAIKEAFIKRGAQIVSASEPADAYVINTCTVTNIADRKSRKYIRQIRKLSPDAVIVVTGCYAQVAADELKEFSEIDMIIGNNLKSTICDRVYEAFNDRSLANEVDVLDYGQLCSYESMGLVTSSEISMSRAYIKIQEGCDRFCSYCSIPFARGTMRSRSLDEIVQEAEMLTFRGYKELILTGINTALYGEEAGFSFDAASDEVGLSGLEVVLSRINALPGDFRIRLSSLEPTVVTADNVSRLIGYDKLCHHVHLSIQSGSTRVLKAMNRHYTRNEYLKIVDMLREFDPEYGITTDIIVGFPGETDEDFSDTLEIVEKARFARVHIFKYSPRKGTKAAMIEDVVPGIVKNERAEILKETAQRVASEFNKQNFGICQKVLIEENEGGYAIGYSDNYIRMHIPDKNGTIKTGIFADVIPVKNFKDGCMAVFPDDLGKEELQ